MCCTWFLSAAPVPTTDCLIWHTGYYRRPSCLAQLQGGAGTPGHEHLLDGQFPGAVQFHQFGDTVVNYPQSCRQVAVGQANHTAGDVFTAPGHVVDYAKACFT